MNSAIVWQVRRELWENRSIYLAPLIVAGVIALASFGVVRHNLQPDNLASQAVILANGGHLVERFSSRVEYLARDHRAIVSSREDVSSVAMAPIGTLSGSAPCPSGNPPRIGTFKCSR